MSPDLPRLDMGVLIGRVIVRIQPNAPKTRPLGQRPGKGRPGDHRIVVGELLIDTQSTMDELDARRLGHRMAAELGEHLALLQNKRLNAILEGRSQGGRVYIDTLTILLRGDEAKRPNIRAAALSLRAAVEREVA